ncbi:DUF3077 domain-containing protein [Pseudomonas sp. S75]|uniref:DUF3077 domain-containing protein n=1 Tax=unclassified Pseudomonas TaxID=196821 RepID=UPI001904FE19|nr:MULTISPECIES: DUF3077 domain-containing protein [unclassified Pseudomonas]MBJ9976629.1 DUF3077 domain-containing protein [Pseudomonas sp. S30]MBK0154445.1 DUF3077 domain-containing protein [Pseudomonas sp. S75]
MSHDDQSSKGPGLKVVSGIDRLQRRPRMNWVQAIPGLPAKDALMEISAIMSCVTEITRRAINHPSESAPLMRATYYLSGMTKAMIDGQLASLRGEPPQGDVPTV